MISDHAETAIMLDQICKLRRALLVAINSVECASVDRYGIELPWYVGAKAVLMDSGGMAELVKR